MSVPNSKLEPDGLKSLPGEGRGPGAEGFCRLCGPSPAKPAWTPVFAGERLYDLIEWDFGAGTDAKRGPTPHQYRFQTTRET